MRKKLFIVLGLILGVTIIGGGAYVTWMMMGSGGSEVSEQNAAGSPEPFRIPTTQVLVSMQPIRRGSEFVPGSVGRREWPANNVPPDIVAVEAEFDKKVARQNIVQGAVMVRSMLISPTIWHSDARNSAPAPAAANGRVFFSHTDGELAALETATGTTLWRFQAEREAISGPAVDQGRVYLADGAGVLYALDGQTGQELWRVTDIQGNYILDPAAPAVEAGILYFENRSDNNFYALDAETGQELWRVASSQFAIMTDEMIYFLSYIDDLLAIVDKKTGQHQDLPQVEVLPVSDMAASLPSTTTVSNTNQTPTSYVIVALRPIEKGTEFTAGSIGRRQWPANMIPPDIIVDEAETIGKVARTNIAPGQVIVRDMFVDRASWQLDFAPVVSNGVGYFVRMGTLSAVNLYTRQELWNQPAVFSPAVADGIVYFVNQPLDTEFGGFATRLVAVEATSGQEQWTFVLPASNGPSNVVSSNGATVSDRKVYLTISTALYALDRDTGRQLWSLTTEAPIASPLTIADDTIYFSDTERGAYAIEAETGQLKW